MIKPLLIFLTIVAFMFTAAAFIPTVPDAQASSASAKKDEVRILEKQIKLEVQKLKNIESKIHHIKAKQKAKIKNLIILYSSMSPKSAAVILPRINKGVAIYILSNMSPRTASAIVSRMTTKDAVFFTNSIAGK